MKVLLDENLPHQLRRLLTGHEVYTAAFMQWSGIENGELLQLACDEKFDALISNDRGLQYQQNSHSLPVAVIVLMGSANTMQSIAQMVPEILNTLNILEPRELVCIGI